MTRVICVASGKGGVGKTMFTANIGTALRKLGKDVVILDSNLTTPNLGIHLGIPLYPQTLHDVLKGKASIHEAIYEHESGLKIIPAGISVRDMKGADPRDLSSAVLDLLGTTDIVIMDGSAGLGREAISAIETSDEMIIITNPDLPSVTDALKTMRIAQEIGTKITGVVINRITGRSHEMSTENIISMLGNIPVLAEIPEDEKVKKSISKRSPVVHRYPKSKPSKEIMKAAHAILGINYREEKPWYRRMFSR